MNTHILLIDDSSDNRFILREVLHAPDFDLACAASGMEGILLAETTPTDLVILEVNLPSADGFEVCRALKSNPATRSIPIMFLTAASTTEEKIKGLTCGAIDYVTKPFDCYDLQARVNAALRTKQLIDLMGQSTILDAMNDAWRRN